MNKIIKDSGLEDDSGMAECCEIAVSMIEEVHQIAVPYSSDAISVGGRHKGSLKRRLLRQIRMARGLADL